MHSAVSRNICSSMTLAFYQKVVVCFWIEIKHFSCRVWSILNGNERKMHQIFGLRRGLQRGPLTSRGGGRGGLARASAHLCSPRLAALADISPDISAKITLHRPHRKRYTKYIISIFPTDTQLCHFVFGVLWYCKAVSSRASRLRKAAVEFAV